MLNNNITYLQECIASHGDILFKIVYQRRIYKKDIYLHLFALKALTNARNSSILVISTLRSLYLKGIDPFTRGDCYHQFGTFEKTYASLNTYA